MRVTAGVVATDSVAQQAASGYLEAGGDAVGAAVCGFFAAAGQHPQVLLGPTALMLARVGVGVRAFDGRSRQGGRGLRRRKGYADNAPLPEAARAPVPAGLIALLVALRYGQGTGLAKVVAPGVVLAQRAGATRRAEVLSAVQRLGASVLAESSVSRALIHRCGPTEGGILTSDDLHAVPEVDHVAIRSEGVFRLPWESTPAAQQSTAVPQPGIVVVDAGGGVAVLGYSDANEDVLNVPELELALPLYGVAAKRGVRRVASGEVLPWPRRLGIELTQNAVPHSGWVDVGAQRPLTLGTEGASTWEIEERS